MKTREGLFVKSKIFAGSVGNDNRLTRVVQSQTKILSYSENPGDKDEIRFTMLYFAQYNKYIN